jgi:peptidoglycan/xylan/chitin deacetylase (PgdA/CDA1 family)
MLVTIDVEYPDRPVSDPLATLDSILKVVERHRQPVGFFVQGRWAVAHPEWVKRMGALDPDLALHGYSHVNNLRLSVEGFDQEIKQGLHALRTLLPDHTVRFYRFPHGLGGDNPALLNVLSENGLTSVGWDHASRDWDIKLSDEESWARISPAQEKGGVVLFHSWVPRTVTLLDRLLEFNGTSRAIRAGDMPLPYQAPTGRVHLNIL